ncbi:MAG: hypothetical protein WC728_01935 [Elusimicrobiota bacterium]
MKKTWHIIKETLYLVRKEKLMFLLPLLLVLALLAFFAYQLGPTVIVSFIYAGL